MKVSIIHMPSLLATILFYLTVTPVFATPPEGYHFVSYQKAVQLSKTNGKPIFIYMGRHGCGFCDRTNKESFSNPEVKQKMESTFNLVYMNSEGGRRVRLSSGETITESQYAERLNILGTPVFITLAPDLEVLDVSYGYQTDGQLLSLAKQ